MYKVLLIDDEMMIRQGLRTIVDWDYYGFYVVGEAADGLEGKQKVLEIKPDLILVDIRMPGLDGIELIKQLRHLGYQGKVIILTGYSEFQYAKEAIHLEVVGYLLKPIEEEELCKLLLRIKDDLDKRVMVEATLSAHESLEQKQVLRQVLLGEEVESAKVAKFFDDQTQYYVTLINREDEENKLLLDRFVLNSPQTTMVVFEGHYAILFPNKTYHQLQIMLQELQKKLKHAGMEAPFITTGRQVKGADKISRSYQEAKSLLDRQFLFRNTPLIFFETYETERHHGGVVLMDGHYLFGLIEVGNLEALEVYFSKMENQFIASHLQVDKIRGLCVNTLIEIKEKLLYAYADIKDVFPENVTIINHIYEQKHLSEILSYMKELFMKASDLVCDGSSDNTMKRLLNYIHVNYYKDLKLEGLAKLFNYNASYLGKVFKQTTGTNFNAYLDTIRIEHAKQLLEDEEGKVYEIAERVGYKSVDYFYAKFKKHVGISPKVYKKSVDASI